MLTPEEQQRLVDALRYYGHDFAGHFQRLSSYSEDEQPEEMRWLPRAILDKLARAASAAQGGGVLIDEALALMYHASCACLHLLATDLKDEVERIVEVVTLENADVGLLSEIVQQSDYLKVQRGSYNLQRVQLYEELVRNADGFLSDIKRHYEVPSGLRHRAMAWWRRRSRLTRWGISTVAGGVLVPAILNGAGVVSAHQICMYTDDVFWFCASDAVAGEGEGAALQKPLARPGGTDYDSLP